LKKKEKEKERSLAKSKKDEKEKERLKKEKEKLFSSLSSELKELSSLPAAIKVKVSNIYDFIGQRIVIRGWAAKIRQQGLSTMFVALRDGSIRERHYAALATPDGEKKGEAKMEKYERVVIPTSLVTTMVQCVLTGECSRTLEAKTISRECYLEIKGRVKSVFMSASTTASAGKSTETATLASTAGEDIEIVVDYWKQLGASDKDISARYNSKSSVQQLADERPLVLREERQTLIFKVMGKLAQSIRTFMDEKDVSEVFPPILGEMEVEGSETLMRVDYFDKKNVTLSQSGQLYLQMALRMLSSVYVIARSFRAEKSRSRRHQTEFDHFEAEMITDLPELLNFIEELVCYVSRFLLDKCGPIVKQFNPDFKVPQRPFPKMTYHEAIKYCGEHGIMRQQPRTASADGEEKDEREDHEKPYDLVPIVEGDDLVESVERQIVDKVGTPLFLTKFRKCDKAFYVKEEEGKEEEEKEPLSQSADLLMPGVGETFGSGIREDSYEKIVAACKQKGLTGPQYSWFCELNKYGSVQTGGFGMGMQRFMCWVLKLPHIRDVTMLERTITRVSP
jgi:asparaginyl-tRNA synthetase